MVYTTAKMKDPKAKEPKWYLKALYKLLRMGAWAVPSG